METPTFSMERLRSLPRAERAEIARRGAGRAAQELLRGAEGARLACVSALEQAGRARGTAMLEAVRAQLEAVVRRAEPTLARLERDAVETVRSALEATLYAARAGEAEPGTARGRAAAAACEEACTDAAADVLRALGARAG